MSILTPTFDGSWELSSENSGSYDEGSSAKRDIEWS